MVRYKMTFAGTAEQLFRIMAPFIPVDNLHVEEIANVPSPPNQIATYGLKKLRALTKVQTKVKVRATPARKRGVDLKQGVNRIVVDLLSDGKPHAYAEIKQLVPKYGYSGHGIGSRLSRLKEHGVVEPVGDGTWRLTNAPTKA